MSERKIILVVDDDFDMREILGCQIEELNYECISAENGEDALGKLKDHPVDVIISDLTMPTMNGIEFLRQCRKNGFDKPFIILTGNATKNVAMESLRLGAFDFLEKPYESDHMAVLFKNAMAQSKKQQRDQLDDLTPSSQSTNFLDEKAEFVSKILSEDSIDPFERCNSAEDFIDYFSHQMSFCKASVKALTKKSQAPIELGYLYRVTRSLTFSSKYWGFFNLCAMSFQLSEMILYFRANPQYLDKNYIEKIALGINSCANYFSALGNKNSVMWNTHKVKTDFQILNESFKNRPNPGEDSAQPPSHDDLLKKSS